MKWAIFTCSFFLLSACLPLKKVGILTAELHENSGMIVTNNGIWFISDSGNPAMLYKTGFDTKIQRRLLISNAQNIDWEAVCTDKNGNFYIGDIGNNSNLRKNLCIYKIPNPDSFKGDSIKAEKLLFFYPEQREFPPAAKQKYYDAEAMIAFGDSLYIFTKNRSRPNDGNIFCYSLPNQFGAKDSIKAQLSGLYRIKHKNFLNAITAATLTVDEKILVLLSMRKLYIFSDFEKGRFFDTKKVKTYRLRFTQKEAMGFSNDRTLYISDEKSILGNSKLYRSRFPIY